MTARALFNGTCDGCLLFRPRCAHVLVKGPRHYRGAKPPEAWHVLCDLCRKQRRGLFTLHPKHQSPKE